MQNGSNATKIPPRTRAKIERLSGDERREYLVMLMKSYENKIIGLTLASTEMVANWVENQRLHLALVMAELQELLESEFVTGAE